MDILTTQMANRIATKCVGDIISDYLKPPYEYSHSYLLADYDLNDQDLNIKEYLHQRDISVNSENVKVVRSAISIHLNKYIKKIEQFDNDMRAMVAKDYEEYQ